MSPDRKLVNGNPNPDQLPIGDTLKMSAAFLRENIGALAMVSLVPTALIILALSFFGAFNLEAEPANPLTMLPSSLISGAFMAVIMAAVGRMVLFGESPERFGIPAFGREEALTWGGSIVASFATGITFAVIFGVVFALTSSLTFALLVGAVPAITVATALALIYPVILTTGRLDFRRAIGLAQGQIIRLLAVIFIASFITVLIAFALMSLLLAVSGGLVPEEGLEDFTIKFTAVFMVLIQVATAIVNVAVISHAFRWIDYYSSDPLLKGD
jgi:hypothetical protein